MRNKFLLIVLLLVGNVATMAQNKTLGVGTATPNPNAALHVESPTNNQGFILPRLTTAQRTAGGFTSILSTADNGLMVYDTDSKAIYIWSDTTWRAATLGNAPISVSTTSLGNAASFSVNNALNTSAAIYATTNGTGSPTTSAAILGETSTAFSAVTGIATGPAGSNAIFGTSSSSNAFSFAVYGGITGGGVGGKFSINNATNTSNALEASTNGTGGVSKFQVTNVASTKPAFWAETNSNQPLTAAVYGLNTGTGDAAGYFRINNAASTRIALAGETNGTGSSVYGLNLGTGNGAYFRKNGSNAGSSAVWGDNFGNDGYAGIFQNISATNPKAALFAESVGTGPSIWANKDPSETGNSMEATHSGTAGKAGYFKNSNTSNTSNTLEAESNSTSGSTIRAIHTGTGDAILATANSGSGGNFQNSNASNNASALFAITNAPNGYGVGAMNTANGNAFAIFQGGIQLSSLAVVAPATITSKSALYEITGTGNINLPAAGSVGETCWVANSSGAGITVNGVIPVSNGTIRQFIRLTGGWQIVN